MELLDADDEMCCCIGERVEELEGITVDDAYDRYRAPNDKATRSEWESLQREDPRQNKLKIRVKGKPGNPSAKNRKKKHGGLQSCFFWLLFTINIVFVGGYTGFGLIISQTLLSINSV